MLGGVALGAIGLIVGGRFKDRSDPAETVCRGGVFVWWLVLRFFKIPQFRIRCL
jgi:hypothetical protein